MSERENCSGSVTAQYVCVFAIRARYMRVFANGQDGERVRLDGEDELRDGNGVRGARHVAPLGEGTPAVDT
jgi:hypothetical protein